MTTLLGLLLAIAAGPPLLTADSATVDRGDVNGGPILKQTFRITNNHATEIVTIAGLESTCGCLRRSVSKSELKPGEAAEVTVEVNTLTQPDGPQTWLVKVEYRTKDKTQAAEELTLRLNAKLSREVSVTPPMIAVSIQTSATATITLTDKRAKPLAVKSLTTTSKLIAAKLRTSAKDTPGTMPIELTFSQEIPAGTHDETLIITTDDPIYSELRVPIRCIKKSAQVVTAHPEFSDIELTAGEGSGIVQFRRADGKSLQISSVESKLPGVTATWSKSSGTVTAIKIVVVAAQAGTKGKGEIAVKFSEPSAHERVLAISWSSD